jgi:hypothetical protein
MTVLLDQAKGISIQGYCRLMGVQCPEVRTLDAYEKKRGNCAKWFTETWFGSAMSGHLHDQEPGSYAFFAYAREDDKYGRWLAHVECIKGHCLNDDLIASNNAISYLGPTALHEEKF